MKATGIVRRIDDLGRVVIPKEIRRTMRIREGDPSQATLTLFDRFWFAIYSVAKKKRRSEITPPFCVKKTTPAARLKKPISRNHVPRPHINHILVQGLIPLIFQSSQ